MEHGPYLFTIFKSSSCQCVILLDAEGFRLNDVWESFYKGLLGMKKTLKQYLFTSNSLTVPVHVHPSFGQTAAKASTSLRAALSGNAWIKEADSFQCLCLMLQF